MDNRFMPYPIDPYLIAERFANYNPEEEAKKQDMMENCCHIEYEQDMGAHIPFCRLDGQMCNMQCLKDKPKPRPIDGDITKAFWDMVWQSPGVKDMRCNCLTEPPKPKMPMGQEEDTAVDEGGQAHDGR